MRVNVEGLMQSEDGRKYLISLAEDLIVKHELSDLISADDIAYMTQRGVHFNFKGENEILLRWGKE